MTEKSRSFLFSQPPMVLKRAHDRIEFPVCLQYDSFHYGFWFFSVSFPNIFSEISLKKEKYPVSLKEDALVSCKKSKNKKSIDEPQ